MFVPVPVEIKVGDIASGLMPAKRAAGQKPAVDMIQGEVVKIEKPKINTTDRLIIVKCKMINDGSIKHFRIAEYRIFEFTFGGIIIQNPKFDKIRIEQEDKIQLAQIIIFP